MHQREREGRRVGGGGMHRRVRAEPVVAVRRLARLLLEEEEHVAQLRTPVAAPPGAGLG